MSENSVTGLHRRSARLIWDYHQLRHCPRKCEAAIGIGSHDAGFGDYPAELYRAGWFPMMVLTGAADPSAYASAHGVPDTAVLVERAATNTGLSITLSREALGAAGIRPSSVMLIAEPHLQRRAYATCRKVWPEVEAVCVSRPLSFDEYVASAGCERRVIETLVGDLQRVIEYPWRGYAIAQEVPTAVHVAYRDLLGAGYTGRLLGAWSRVAA